MKVWNEIYGMKFFNDNFSMKFLTDIILMKFVNGYKLRFLVFHYRHDEKYLRKVFAFLMSHQVAVVVLLNVLIVRILYLDYRDSNPIPTNPYPSLPFLFAFSLPRASSFQEFWLLQRPSKKVHKKFTMSRKKYEKRYKN